jgi:hypothetical protein
MKFLNYLTEETNRYHSISIGFNKPDIYESIEEDLSAEKDKQKALHNPIHPTHFAKLHDHHDSLVKHYSNYTDNDRDHIEKYSRGSSSLNSHLYHTGNAGQDPHTTSDNDTGNFHSHHIHGMDAVLSRHKTPHAFHVYTGIHKEHNLHDVGHVQNAHAGKPIKAIHHGYTSTSIDKDTASSFAHSVVHQSEETIDDHIHSHEHVHKHILKIHVPKGHPGGYIAHHSKYDNEKEFVLPRGTKLHIHHKPKKETVHHSYVDRFGGKDHTMHIHHHTYVWHARIKE